MERFIYATHHYIVTKMYKGITYGLRTLALAAIAGCGSTESKLENEVIKPNLAPSTLELPDDREELRAEVKWYRERLDEVLNRRAIPIPTPRGRLLDSKKLADKELADQVSSYNPIITPSLSLPDPNLAIIVGDQASASDVVGYIPQKFSRPLVPPYEPEVPWNTYMLITLGLIGAYLIGHIIGERKERKKSREMTDGLVQKFGTGRSVGDLLRTPPLN